MLWEFKNSDGYAVIGSKTTFVRLPVEKQLKSVIDQCTLNLIISASITRINLYNFFLHIKLN